MMMGLPGPKSNRLAPVFAVRRAKKPNDAKGP